MEALENLGIDFTAMLAQAVNFGLLLFILWRFLYKPITKMLNERSEKIADSLEKSAQIEKEYENIESKKEKLLIKAKEDAAKVVDDARTEAKKIEKDAVFEAETKAKAILQNAQIEAQKEKLQIIEEAKDDVATLVEESLNSILKKDTKRYDDVLINEALAGFIEKE